MKPKIWKSQTQGEYKKINKNKTTFKCMHLQKINL